MAFYIPMKLVLRTDDIVEYEYEQPIHEPDPAHPRRLRVVGTNVGRARLHLRDQVIECTLGADWDAGERVFSRVAMKMLQCVRDGQFPDQTCWAS